MLALSKIEGLEPVFAFKQIYTYDVIIAFTKNLILAKIDLPSL